MRTIKAMVVVSLCMLSMGVFAQSDSLRANNYPNAMPYVPGKIPDYKNTHMNIHDTAFINAHKRAAEADSAAVPKKTKMP